MQLPRLVSTTIKLQGKRNEEVALKLQKLSWHGATLDYFGGCTILKYKGVAKSPKRPLKGFDGRITLPLPCRVQNNC